MLVVTTVLLLSPYLVTSLPTSSPCSTDDIGSLKRHTSECSQYYYCAPDNQAILSSCPSQHYFHATSSRCIPHHGETCETFSTPDTCPPTPTCTIFDLLQSKPYPPDCKKYIYCSITGQTRVLSCLLGYHFSPVTNSCQRIAEAQCPFCVEAPPITPAPNTTPVPTLPPTCEETPTCTIEEVGFLKPYPSNCTLYIYCAGENEMQVRFCPNDFEFSSDVGMCLPASEANCPTCIESTVTPTPPTCPPMYVECTNEDIGYLKPYPADCQKYVTCIAENEYEIRYCPQDQEFSPTENICLPETEAKCPKCTAVSTTPVPPKCPPIISCTISDAGILKPYSPDCTMYLYCDSEGDSHCSKCPSSRPHFSAKLNYCTSIQEAACENCGAPNINTIDCSLPVCEPVQTCTNIGDLLPYPPNCSKYIYCDGTQEGVTSQCETNQHFSTSKRECVSREEANCKFCIV